MANRRVHLFRRSVEVQALTPFTYLIFTELHFRKSKMFECATKTLSKNFLAFHIFYKCQLNMRGNDSTLFLFVQLEF